MIFMLMFKLLKCCLSSGKCKGTSTYSIIFQYSNIPQFQHPENLNFANCLLAHIHWFQVWTTCKQGSAFWHWLQHKKIYSLCWKEVNCLVVISYHKDLFRHRDKKKLSLIFSLISQNIWPLRLLLTTYVIKEKYLSPFQKC